MKLYQTCRSTYNYRGMTTKFARMVRRENLVRSINYFELPHFATQDAAIKRAPGTGESAAVAGGLVKDAVVV